MLGFMSALKRRGGIATAPAISDPCPATGLAHAGVRERVCRAAGTGGSMLAAGLSGMVFGIRGGFRLLNSGRMEHRRLVEPRHQTGGGNSAAGCAGAGWRFANAFDTAAAAMLICRARDGEIVHANRSAAGLLGRPADSLIGVRVDEVLAPDGGADSAWWRVDKENPPSQEARLATGPGERWVRARAAPLPAGDGGPREAVIFLEDVTQQRRDSEELRRRAARLADSADQLEHSRREIDEFSYAASHDLKESLRGLHSAAAFMLLDYEAALDEQGKERLRSMQRQTRRAEALLDALLRLSRLGRARLSLETVDLGAAAERVRQSLRGLLAARGASLEIEGPLPTVLADPSWVGVLLECLVENGVKFNDSPSPRVRVGARKGSGGEPVLEVTDNGIGIPDHHRETVFRTFKRLHGREHYGGGAGAGLSIARRIVERHGGRIWIEAGAGGGTVVRFTLGGTGREHAQDAALHPGG
jgi:PAS domain S-box-containing protein